MLTAFLASLACLALRIDGLAALNRNAASLPSCGSLRTLDYRALLNAECASAQRLMRDAHVPAADRRVAASMAREMAAPLLRSLDMTVRRTLGRRACPCCHELRDPAAFEPDGACELCHIDLSAIAAAQHDAARTAIEAELETWPVAPPALAWELDSEPESDEVECPACDGHGDVPSGRHSAHDPLGLVECKCCRGERFVSRRSLLNASAREVA